MAGDSVCSNANRYKHDIEATTDFIWKWDINVEDRAVFYNDEKIPISEKQWEILEFLMSDSDLWFTTKEIAYALRLTEASVLTETERLLNTITEKTGSPIIKRETGRYKFEEIVV